VKESAVPGLIRLRDALTRRQGGDRKAADDVASDLVAERLTRILQPTDHRTPVTTRRTDEPDGSEDAGREPESGTS
jgi:hypothetical protein